MPPFADTSTQASATLTRSRATTPVALTLSGAQMAVLDQTPSEQTHTGVVADLVHQRYTNRRGDSSTLATLWSLLQTDASMGVALHVDPYHLGDDGVVYLLHVQADGALTMSVADRYAAAAWYADLATARDVCESRR